MGLGLRLALGGLFVASGVVACKKDEGPYFGTTERVGKETTTFYVNNGSEPEYLDPGKVHDSASSALAHQMFEGLAIFDPREGKPVPGAAVSYDKSDDNRFFRFHMRKDAKWSDGKPVTAHDFEYAWKRVLLPSTASRAASNLYPLLNGELINQGLLKVATTDLDVVDAPGGKTAAKVTKGTALRILATSPMTATTGVAPLAKQPSDDQAVSYDADDDTLSVGSTSHGAKGDAGAQLTVLSLGAETSCNGAPDHWYEVQTAGGPRGFLPGCVLKPVSEGDTYALVARHDRRPTFKPHAAPVEDEGKAAPIGFVPEGSLEIDTSVIGVKAEDDHTLLVELDGPTPYFIDLTMHTSLAPVRKDIVEPFEERGEPELWYRPESIVVNGPYILDEWKFRYEITMKRNPHYYNHDKLKIHRIVWLEVESYHGTMNLYKTGEIDYIGQNLSLPSEYLEMLEKKGDFTRSWYLSTYWYEFNTEKEPVNDVRVRRALNLAVDKQQLIDKITRAGQKPATHYVPPYTGLGYSDRVKADKESGKDPFDQFAFNPEKARELLAEAGYPVKKDGDGFVAPSFPKLDILYNTSEGHKQIAVAIQDMWKRHLGISATIRNEEWKVMLKNLRDGNFTVVRMGWVADYNHPHTYMDTFLSYSPQNRTHWKSAEFDNLIKEAAATADEAKSIELYRQAELVAAKGMAKMPLYFYTKSTLVKPYVKGFFGNSRDEHLVQWMWIDDSWKNESPRTNEPAYEVPAFPKPGSYE